MNQKELFDWFEKQGLAPLMDDREQHIVNLGNYRDAHPDGYLRLGEATHLRELAVTCDGFADAHLAKIKGLRFLNEVDLPICKVTGHGLSVLPTLPRISRFSFPMWHEADEGLAYIGQCTTLKSLHLQGAFGISDAGLPSLSHLTHLEILDLSYTSVGAGVSIVEQFPELRKLLLILTKVGPGQLRHIIKLDKLKDLWLPDCFSEEDLLSVARLKRLETLCIGGRTGTRGLVALHSLPVLETLYIPRLMMTDDAFESLAGFPNLDIIYLSKHNCTPEQHEWLDARVSARIHVFDDGSGEDQRERQYRYSDWLKLQKQQAGSM
ncbi:MAG: hypothetical protein KDA90_06930 [Planctomycetaceae bacterium]|nr:hypothetical protein [Planctomycetaceae bacterium]